MQLFELNDASFVHAAMKLCDEMTPDEFRRQRGFGQARRYVVVHDGKAYDSKVIAAVAYSLQFPDRPRPTATDLKGGTRTVVRLLQRLGFRVERADPQGTQSGARVFLDDETGYLQWLEEHADGLVLNSYRDPSPSYFPLHRTTCRTIRERNSAMSPGAFTKDYIKICALDHATLLDWIRERGGESFTDFCSKCDAPHPPPPVPVLERDHWEELQDAVDASLRLDDAELAARLATEPEFPSFVTVVRREFDRSYYVIAAVLRRAAGICERCKKPAPFQRRTDGTPFLEVHHKIPLSQHGTDTVDNAQALCPNCHRESHFGAVAGAAP